MFLLLIIYFVDGDLHYLVVKGIMSHAESTSDSKTSSMFWRNEKPAEVIPPFSIYTDLSIFAILS